MPIPILLVNGVPPPAHYGTSREAAPKLRSVQFGDGYEQIAPDGLNHNLLKLDVSFSTLTAAERAALCAFLDARGGHEPFKWTGPAPYDVEKFYRCREWQEGWDEFDKETVSARFDEVVIPGE